MNTLLTFVAPLTSAPTAWAIFAGITKDRTAIPMNDWIAGVGAISILLVDIAAAVLMVDAYKFKQSASSKTELKMIQPLWWSISILIVAISAEMMLSLVIVIFKQIQAWGVIVFPFMTLAGAFAVASRIDLTERENLRERERSKAEAKRLKKEKEEQEKKEERNKKARETRLESKRKKEEAEALELKAKAEQELARKKELEELTCKFPVLQEDGTYKPCGYSAKSKKELAGHMRAHPRSEREEVLEAVRTTEKKGTWICDSCGTINKNTRVSCRECGKEAL